MHSGPIILPSAFRHGVSEDDMLHAMRNAVDSIEGRSDMLMVIGPARDATMLEIGIIRAIDDEELVIVAHAMPLRTKYTR